MGEVPASLWQSDSQGEGGEGDQTPWTPPPSNRPGLWSVTTFCWFLITLHHVILYKHMIILVIHLAFQKERYVIVECGSELPDSQVPQYQTDSKQAS